jgi:inosose dehydratase
MSAIPVANAPCSWGVLEFERTKKEAGYERVLDEMAQAGYAGTELGDWGFMPTDPPELSRALARRKLALLGAFVPVALAQECAHEPGVAAAVCAWPGSSSWSIPAPSWCLPTTTAP